MIILPIRKPNRLHNHDYSKSGAYFVTICTKNRQNLFGHVNNGQMVLNFIGKIAKREIISAQHHHNNVIIKHFIIMPNHVHAIIEIYPTERINPFPTADIPNIVGKYKASVTRNVGKAFMRSVSNNIWQKSYHDHIIKNNKSYYKIANYIRTNPQTWEYDCHYN